LTDNILVAGTGDVNQTGLEARHAAIFFGNVSGRFWCATAEPLRLSSAEAAWRSTADF
jgi:hypothetical protein